MGFFDREWRKGSSQIKYHFVRLLTRTICLNCALLIVFVISLVMFSGLNKLYAFLDLAVLVIADIFSGILLHKIYSQYKTAQAEENELLNKNNKVDKL